MHGPIRIRLQHFSNLVILHTYLPMKMEQCFPKRRHIKFIRRRITQKKARKYSVVRTQLSCTSIVRFLYVLSHHVHNMLRPSVNCNICCGTNVTFPILVTKYKMLIQWFLLKMTTEMFGTLWGYVTDLLHRYLALLLPRLMYWCLYSFVFATFWQETCRSSLKLTHSL